FYYDKAFSLLLKKEYARSLALYDLIEKRFGTDARLFAARKDLFMRQDVPEKAIEVAKEYIKLWPESSQAPLMLANVYLELVKPDLALTALIRAEIIFGDEAFIPLTIAAA